MAYCSRINRALGFSLFMLLGLISLIPNAFGTMSAPMVTSLSSISNGTRTPVRISIDQWGDIYVSDPRGGGVNRFNNAGKLQKSFPVATSPLGIAAIADDTLLVSQGTAVQALDKFSGEVKATFGIFKKANGITVDKAGLIYVVDSLDDCVQVFNADYTPRNISAAAAGKPANSFGATGNTNGLFHQPTGISYEKIADQIAVVDTLNGRVEFFSTAGVWQKNVGSFGGGPLKFTAPQAIAFEYTADAKTLARMYVVDTFQSIIQAIDATTASPTFLRYIGNYGMKPGELVVPSDIIFDSSDSGYNRLIVANGSGQLALYGIAGRISGDSSASATGPTLTIDSYPLATNLGSLTISGKIANADTVKVNGVTATLSGTSWASLVTLKNGTNVIAIEAQNATGGISRYITIDAIAQSGTPLVLTVDNFPSPTKSSSIILKGTVTDGVDSVTVNGVAAGVTGSTWSKAVTLTTGANNFLVTAQKVGFATASNSVNIMMDDVAPLLETSKLFMMSNGKTTAQPIQTVTGRVTDASPCTVTVTVNGVTQSTAPVNDGLFSLPVTLSLGANTLSIVATDVAGNVSLPLKRTVTYEPKSAKLVVNIPNNAVVVAGSTPQYSFTFTAPAGYTATVTAAGAPAATLVAAPADQTGKVVWTASVNSLVSGINLVEVSIASNTDPTKVSTIARTVIYTTASPFVAITSPPQDITTTQKTFVVTGKSTPGSAITALVNGEVAQVGVNDSGDFALLVAFTATGRYEIVVTATDSNGISSTSYRTLVYSTVVPKISFNKATRKYTAENGILYAKDKDGNFVTTGVDGSGTATLDLSNYQGTDALNVFALGAGGDSTRNGDLSPAASKKGYVDITDVMKALRISSGLEVATDDDLLSADLATSNGKPVLDGKIGNDDVITILHFAVGFGQ